MFINLKSQSFQGYIWNFLLKCANELDRLVKISFHYYFFEELYLLGIIFQISLDYYLFTFDYASKFNNDYVYPLSFKNFYNSFLFTNTSWSVTSFIDIFKFELNIYNNLKWTFTNKHGKALSCRPRLNQRGIY